jgi:beta-lactamase superfamily II metal-dependent hydrolase
VKRAACLVLALALGCGQEPPEPRRRAPTEAASGARSRAAARLPSLSKAPGLDELGVDRAAGDGKLHVQLFDVGHGDAALVISPTGRTVLVDTGPAESAAFLASRLSEQVQQPLDLLVLSNGLPEHAGGLESVLRATSAQRMLVPSPEGTGLPEALKIASLRGVAAYSPELQGEQLSVPLGGGAALEVLWPRAPKALPVDAAARDEANGLVLRVTLGETAILFAGDARAETEAALLRSGQPVQATVLKIASHALDVATGEPWLSAVGPLAAVVSFGAGNAVGAPSATVLDRLARSGVATWRTDLDGEIQLESDGQGVDLLVERPTAGDPPGMKHRYVRGKPAARFSPSAPRPVMAAAPAPRPAVPVASAALPTSAVAQRPPAAQQPAAPVQAAPPAPVQKSGKPPAAGDDLDLPSNWGKPAAKPGATPVAEAAPETPKRAPATTPAAPRTAPTATPSAAGGFVASSRAKVFHAAGCSAAQKIKPENLATFRTREEAAAGRSPAKDCNP